jgi:hypothetical protein
MIGGSRDAWTGYVGGLTKRSSGGLRAAALPVGRDSGEALLHVL